MRLKHVLPAMSVLAAVLAGCGSGRETPMAKVPRYEVFETTVSSDKTYDNPFTEATLRARFTGPKGRKVELAGFYSGGGGWKR